MLIRCIDFETTGLPDDEGGDQRVNPERWLPVVGFEGRYEVSDLGRVKSLGRTETYSRILNNDMRGEVTRTKRERILATSMAGNGYLTVRLLGKTFSVHVIVLEAFVGRRPEKHVVCHGDGNRENNRLSNLRWDTYAANNAERFVHGMKPVPRSPCGKFQKQRGGQ